MQQDELLSVSNLAKSFANQSVIKHLSFSLKRGQITAMLGANGTGKSTCLSVLATKMNADAGDIDYAFHSVTPAKARQHIGILAQKTSLMYDVTVQEYLMFCGKLFALDSQSLHHAIDDYCQRFQIQHLKTAPIQSLSGGMQRVVDIIRVFLHQPSLLLFDEPTQGLDVNMRQRLWRIVKHYCQQHSAACLLATHILEDVDVCQQVFFIDQGQCVKSGVPSQLIKQLGELVLEINYKPGATELMAETFQLTQIARHEQRVIYALKNDQHVDAILEHLGQDLTEINLRKPTLNDVFMGTVS